MPENENGTKRKLKAPTPSLLAQAEIDRRLAEAIKERTKLHAAVSKLRYAQDRLGMVEQEINSLVQLQQRLNGKDVMPPLSQPMVTAAGSVPLDQIGSVPTRQPGPVTANVATSVAKDGGFA